jgi:PAS domain S-box-containing protein
MSVFGRVARSFARLAPGTSWPLLAAAVTVIALGTAAVHSLGDTDGLVEQRWRHTQALLGTERLLATLADAESGQRGYLLTGRPAYLEPYTEAGRRLTLTLAELEASLSDQPDQREAALTLHALIKENLAELARTIELRRQGRSEDVLRMLGTDRSRLNMERIRQEARKIADRAQLLRDERTREYISSIRQSFFVVVGGSAVLFVLTAFATMTTARELRARALAEQAARQRGERYRSLVDASSQVIWTADRNGLMAGDQSGWSGLTGQLENEAAGHGWLAAVHPEDREDTRSKWAAAIAQGRVFATEHRVRRADGSWARFAVRAVPVLDELGGLREWVGVHTDVTESKRAEAERERLVRALAKSNQDLNEFAYVASHDLKAPLRAITHLSEWLEEDMGSAIPGPALEKLHLLRGRARRLEGLIEGILNYSRAGRSGAGRSLVDVRALLREVVDLLGKPALEAVAIADAAWPALSTERAALEQVFMNLISNALKHGSSDGRPIEVGVTREDGFWRFSVADHGPGIPPEYHERIWGIFQMLQARDKVEGAGIGLAIVKKIVERKGGRAWVVSAAGAGATFCFTWPQHDAESA